MEMLNFENLGDVLDDDEQEETKFEKFGAFHKTNVVFLLDLTHDMMLPSSMKNAQSGKVISMAYACLVAIRQSVLDMIKHASLGGGGRDRVAVLGLMHKKTVVLLGMQLPSAETIKSIDELLEVVGTATAKEGSTINLGKAFDMAFTLLKELEGDAQIFVCTANDDPCDHTLHKGFSDQAEVCSKAMDLTQNHMMSIKLLAVPIQDRLKPFNVNIFWRDIVSDQGCDNRDVLATLQDLTQHVRSLTRPTAITVPSGSNMKLRIRNPNKRNSFSVQMHVNLYALSRSRELNPSKSFRVDVDDGAFLAEARIRDGAVHTKSGDLYAATQKSEKAEDEIPDAVGSPTKADDEDSQMLFQKKKVLKFRDSDMKIWDIAELANITRHDNPRCIDIVGFIQNNRINREFRGQSPQYLTMAKSLKDEEASYWSALWHSCRRLNVSCVAILYLHENKSPKQVLLSAHSEVRDIQGSVRLPNGFYVHHLPYRDRVYVEVRPKQSTGEIQADERLMQSLQRALQAISGPYFYPVGDKNADKQWSVLEALALDQEPPNLESGAVEYPRAISADLENIRAICGSSTQSTSSPTKPKRSRKK